jgi:hypothetical protein
MEKSKKSRVKVGVRVRPALEREVVEGKFNNCVGVGESKIYISMKEKGVIIKEGEEEMEGVDMY